MLKRTQFSGVFHFHAVEPPVSVRPPRMSSLCGLLREMAAYESLENIGSKLCDVTTLYCPIFALLSVRSSGSLTGG